MLAFCRYVVLHRKDVHQIKYAIKKLKEEKNEDKSEPFKGYLQSFSRENEADCWRHISQIANESLNKYPTTIQDDNKILEEDDKKPSLGKNKRNCVLFRKIEKEIFHYLRDCARKVESLIKLSLVEADAKMLEYSTQQKDDQSGDFEFFEMYYKNTLQKLLI